jgi:hypothetical protein
MKRGTWILAGVLALLGIAAWFVTQRPGENSTTGSTGAMLATYDSAAADRLLIIHGGTAVTLERERDRWLVTSPSRHRADPAAVDSALARGRRIELKGLVSSNPAKRGVYHVDSTGTLVRVFGKGTELAAFWIGKAGQTFDEAFVRREGSDEVYEAAGPLSWYFAKSLSEWRDHAIVRTERGRITAVRFRYGDTTFALGLQETTWTVDGKPANPDAVQEVLNSLSEYLANDFVDTAFTPVKPPSASVEFLDTELRFYRIEGTQKFMVRSADSPEWYSVEGWRANELLKRKAQLLGR